MNDSFQKVDPVAPHKELGPEKNKSSSFWKEFGKLLLISLLIIIPFRMYIAQPFVVDGASMDPTFGSGDYLIVDEISYRFKIPERGSVIVFKYPRDTRKSFIKRIIGLPGETVSIVDGKITIFNQNNPDGFLLDEPYIERGKQETLSYTLGEGEYFVMGDNRLSSADSRIWGPVPAENIIGRPILQFLPPAFLPGDYSDYGYQNANSDKNL